MSNHYHLVLRVDEEQAKCWSPDEVIERWYRLFSGTVLVDRYLRGEAKTKAEVATVMELVEIWRERLYDLGWFMRCLNEDIARKANVEDHCKGRFWEGRYKSQALLDETALLSCMAYVDLNPIRAAMAQTPEDSEFTSIQERLMAASKKKRPHKTLTPFQIGKQPKMHEIPIRMTDYFELVELTGKVIREDKRGHIPARLENILSRNDIDPEYWLTGLDSLEKDFPSVMGSETTLLAYCAEKGRYWVKGLNPSRRLFH